MMFRKHLFSLQGMQYQLFSLCRACNINYFLFAGHAISIICVHMYIYIYNYIYTHVIICLCLYCLYVYLEKQMSTYCPWKHCRNQYGQVFVGQCLGLRNGWIEKGN
jgi:hypothetical protein